MSTKRGIEHPTTIDMVVYNSQSDSYTLVIDESRPWDQSVGEALQLQQKISNYASFALDGQLLRLYPESRGKRVTILVSCPVAPEGQTALFLAKARLWLKDRGISLDVMNRTEQP